MSQLFIQIIVRKFKHFFLYNQIFREIYAFEVETTANQALKFQQSEGFKSGLSMPITPIKHIRLFNDYILKRLAIEW